MSAFVDGWNHNSHYYDLLLSEVPRGCTRALDIGCGHGSFARRLAPRSKQVDAVDQDGSAIRQARDLSIHAPNIRYIEAEFMCWPAEEAYDFVSMIAVLHHLPFDGALEKAARLLRVGGVLVVLGLHRQRSIPRALAESLAAFPISLYFRMTRRTSPVLAPTQDPRMTLEEIRQGATTLLPQSSFRRHLLWRYTLVWTKPVALG